MTIEKANKIRKGDLVRVGDDIYRKVKTAYKGTHKGLFQLASPTGLNLIVKASEIRAAYRPLNK